jgi:CRISPR/Cas system CSM-associated protein Csm2 small subunit
MESTEPKVTSNKTYVRGAFLYSEDGFAYEERQKEGSGSTEKVVEDKIGIGELKKELAEKRKELRRKKESKNDKPVLIPIRDTPVEPIPEPVNDNQKCERATQEQFEYFQSYITLREKERKFEEEEETHLQLFLMQQQLARQKQQEAPAPTRGIALVMEKEDSKPRKRALMTIRIKKKEAEEQQVEEEGEERTKVRVLE